MAGADPGEARRVRVAASLTALWIWVLGAEVAPHVHLALHASLAPHTHAASVEARAAGGAAAGRCHDEGGGAHCHRVRRASTRGWDRPAARGEALRAADPAYGDGAHGAGALAHRQAAFLRPASAAAPLVEAPFVALAARAYPASHRTYGIPRAPAMRGPPA